ncbi:MAG: prepilin-type N-terminal cleavage/methylation domain-containing protein [Bacillus sp. (in: Bacteria)]|nr:prepilin-type N-terminal cleavage/methylation domain-containing protein [Bacillus sp. (in: firmicutes)]
MNKFFTQKGYTLIETLLVLLLITSLLLISIPNFEQSIHNKNIDYFFEQLEKDLYESQMKAMSEGIIVRVIFSSTHNNYTVREGTVTTKTRHFPKGLTVGRGSLELTNLRYLPNGNISFAGSIIFRYKEDTYMLVFQLVRGRFYIEKY